MYRIVRDLTGKRSNTNIPIKNKQNRILSTEEEQNKRWIEHFSETLNQEVPINTFDIITAATDEDANIYQGEISVQEVEVALRKLKNNRAPGEDQIAGELLKYGSETVRNELTTLFNTICKKMSILKSWTRGTIVKLPKKGDLSNCNNWRGITLLSIPGKVFCSVLLERIKKEIDNKLREHQAGFRSGRSCIEQIYTLRHIIQQSLEFQQDIYINFIDFKKAFDSIHRDSLWKISRSYGIPDKYINLFKLIYENSSCNIRTQTGVTDSFNIGQESGKAGFYHLFFFY